MPTLTHQGTRPVTVRQRIGLVLAAVLSLTNVPSALQPTPEGQVGPPFVVLLIGTIVGVIGVCCVVIAWRSGHTLALRVLAACLILSALTALPGLFVEMPAAVRALIGATVVVTVAALVLLFSTDRRAPAIVE